MVENPVVGSRKLPCPVFEIHRPLTLDFANQGPSWLHDDPSMTLANASIWDLGKRFDLDAVNDVSVINAGFLSWWLVRDVAV